ncbi:MAG TPA: diacylglycerol kinase family protein [Pyrinomonadaceae bacterium]|jgi:YegS/Rv2252/BmrU family lipid kinase|nr:diacylglycerol kinase family protein [Pyrinomonadaceae bacterium]
MSIRKATLISNPKTGRYASRRAPIPELASRLESLGLKVDLRLTSGPGDATEIANRVARNGTSDVIVAGGDGTINEAIQGLAGTDARLGIIPRGTANVLARELGLPLDDEQALRIAAQGKTRKIYLGLAIDETTNERRHFVLMAGIGLDASVVRRVQPSLKKRIGKGAFWISGLSHLATWNPKPFTLEIEDQKYTATFAAIGKSARYGGDLSITPGARLDEREFEICIIQTMSRLRYLHLLSYAMRDGMPRDNPEVQFVKATSVKAHGDAQVQVDGELLGHLPMRFEIAPHSLNIIVP